MHQCIKILPSPFRNPQLRVQLRQLRIRLHRADTGRRSCSGGCCCCRGRCRRRRTMRRRSYGRRWRWHVMRRSVMVPQQGRWTGHIVVRGDGRRRCRRTRMIRRIRRVVTGRQVRLTRRSVVWRTLRSTLRVRVHRAYVIWFQFAEFLWNRAGVE